MFDHFAALWADLTFAVPRANWKVTPNYFVAKAGCFITVAIVERAMVRICVSRERLLDDGKQASEYSRLQSPEHWRNSTIARRSIHDSGLGGFGTRDTTPFVFSHSQCSLAYGRRGTVCTLRTCAWHRIGICTVSSIVVMNGRHLIVKYIASEYQVQYSEYSIV
jgi:hypothetical protein